MAWVVTNLTFVQVLFISSKAKKEHGHILCPNGILSQSGIFKHQFGDYSLQNIINVE